MLGRSITFAVAAFCCRAGAIISRSGQGTDITQQEAENWLKTHKPAFIKKDLIPAKFIEEHAAEALKARFATPWAQSVPLELFKEYVLPYAHFDEKLEFWRGKFRYKLTPLVEDAQSLEEAAENVQQGIWTAFGKPDIHFKSNSTPQVLSPVSDLLRTRYGSCTALSIFVTDGLRSVGIPARVVGIAQWDTKDKGNHNWVEVWFGGKWNFIDAGPGNQFNHAWFADGLVQDHTTEHSIHGIYTPSWGREANAEYLITWRDPHFTIPAVELTKTYQLLPRPKSGWLSPMSLFLEFPIRITFVLMSTVAGIFAMWYCKRWPTKVPSSPPNASP